MASKKKSPFCKHWLKSKNFFESLNNGLINLDTEIWTQYNKLINKKQSCGGTYNDRDLEVISLILWFDLNPGITNENIHREFYDNLGAVKYSCNTSLFKEVNQNSRF